MTTSTFQGLTEAEQIFKDIVWDPLISAGETALIGLEGPAGPFLGPIEKPLLTALANVLFGQIVLLVDIEALQFVDAKAAAAYADSSLRLKVVIQESGAQSVAYQSAMAAERQALSSFTRFHAV